MFGGRSGGAGQIQAMAPLTIEGDPYRVVGVLDRDYQLGTYFNLTIQAWRGYVDIYYNGAHLVHQAMVEDQCYFKAGCYLQSNTKLGDLPTAYGQVEITSLVLSHS